MKSTILNKAQRMPCVSVLLTAVAVGIHYFYFLRPELLYTRAALNNAEFWRIVSCHWVHLNTDHLLWSAMTFLVLGSVCEIMDRKRYMISIGGSAVIIPIVIWFAGPYLNIYGGLSGLDCSLYALLGVLLIKREWRLRNWVWVIIYTMLLGLLLAKIVYEMATGLTIFVDNNTAMVPVPLSHLAGGLVGIAAGALILRPHIRTSKFLTLWTCICSNRHVKNLLDCKPKLPQLQKEEC
jgi:rhomboid family GlyGly-CTERM serine protease